jgi:hypothetical protein
VRREEGGEREDGGEGGTGCVRGLAVSVRIYPCARADVPIYPRGNFITDATVRPSHGRPSNHRPIVYLSVLNRSCDNLALAKLIVRHIFTKSFKKVKNLLHLQ